MEHRGLILHDEGILGPSKSVNGLKMQFLIRLVLGLGLAFRVMVRDRVRVRIRVRFKASYASVLEP